MKKNRGIGKNKLRTRWLKSVTALGLLVAMDTVFSTVDNSSLHGEFTCRAGTLEMLRIGIRSGPLCISMKGQVDGGQIDGGRLKQEGNNPRDV